MDKDVLSAFHANKPEPLAIIEPLDSAFALHTALLSCYTSPTVPRPTVLGSIPEKAPYESAEELRVCIYHSPSRVSSGRRCNLLCPKPSSITVAGSAVFACGRSTGTSCKSSACRL